MDAADKIKVDLMAALDDLMGSLDEARNKATTDAQRDSCDTVKFLFCEIAEEIRKNW